MTKDELIKKLEQLKTTQDTEKSHVDADVALLYYINDFEIKEAFDNIVKWYS